VAGRVEEYDGVGGGVARRVGVEEYDGVGR